MLAVRRLRLAWAAAGLGAALVGGAGCGEGQPAPRLLPKEWYTAAVDPVSGGRFLPERRAELRRFQAAVRRSGAPVPYGHFDDPRSVTLAIKADFIPTGTRRRLAVLLANEADDPDLSIAAYVDRPPGEILAALDLPGAERIAMIPAERGAPSGASFQFLRDYAPIVLARPTSDGPRTAALAVYPAPTLNKVVDARLGVRIERSEEGARRRSARTRELARAYRERLGDDVGLVELALRMDGGNVLSDGAGTCFAGRVLFAKNGGDRAFVERELREKLACRRSIFLASPQRLDFVQHVDTLLYLAGPEDVVLSMPQLYESDRIAEFEDVRLLLEKGYTVHRVPRPTASITYTNVLTTRDHVYLPQYTRYAVESERQEAINRRLQRLDPRRQADLLAWYLEHPVDTRLVEDDPALERANREALRVFRALFPRKEVVPVNSDETLQTRGSWHCLSHELPDRLGPARPPEETSPAATSSDSRGRGRGLLPAQAESSRAASRAP